MRKRDTAAPIDAFNTAVDKLKLPIANDQATAEETDENTFTIKQTGGTVSDPSARLIYVQVDGKLSLSWRVETDIDSNWLVTYLDAATGENIHSTLHLQDRIFHDTSCCRP